MARRRHGHTPTFPLSQVQELVAWGRYWITDSAIAGGRGIGLGVAEILECVGALTESDYEQTLASIKFPGKFQDVYKPRYYGFPVYLKLQIDEENLAVVISFKLNTTP